MNDNSHTHYYKDFIDFYKFVEVDFETLNQTKKEVLELNNFEELFILDCLEILKSRGMISRRARIDDAVFRNNKVITKNFEFFFNKDRQLCIKIVEKKGKVKFYILKNLMEVKK